MELDSELESPSGQVATPQDTAQEKNRSSDNKEEPGKDDPRGPSADFAALIHAIKREGAAYRKEEQSEDRGKKFRDWVTIGLIACTFGAVCWQVHEMIKVYEPIRLQAVAAQEAAAAAKEQATATTKQAETSAKEIVSASRAWVGPLTATVNQVQKDKPIEGIVQYQNTGREPGIDLYPSVRTKAYSTEEWNNGTAAKEIVTLAQACLGVDDANLPHGLQVVYPTTGFQSYQIHFDTSQGPESDKVIVSDDLIAGKLVFKIQGCFMYRTISSVHHSSYCYFYQANFTSLPNLNICSVGSAAD
jgi:hypothetical protein